MGIKEKIEEIRSKPEHIRMRYVWGSVAVSMIFIIIIWIFSILTMFNNSSSQSQSPDLSPIKDQLQNFKNDVPSIQNISEGVPTNNPTQSNSADQANSVQNENINQ